MHLGRWADWATRNPRSIALLALVTAFAGMALLIDRPKGTLLEWLSIPLLAIGGALFTWAVWPWQALHVEADLTLASRFIQRVTLNGRLTRLFPAIGVGLILADIAYNASLSGSPGIQTQDTIVLLAAIAIIAYGFVPKRFAKERDFVLTFFIALNGILVVPLLLARAYYSDFERSVDLYSWIALAPQASTVLNLVGVDNNLHSVAGSTAPGLTFTPKNLATPVTVVITTACSGIYSFGIFASAFVAYMLTEFNRPSKRVWLLMGLGLASAYVANVLRMVVIVLVGYFTDTIETDLQNMLVAHSYGGWIVFIGWITLFWAALLKFIPDGPSARASVSGATVPAQKKHRCAVCLGALSPTIAAARCACGAYYHVECATRMGACTECGRIALGESVALANDP